MNLTAAILHTVTDRFLVNIQADVIHIFHGGTSLVVAESAPSLSSVFVHQALLLTHTFKQYVPNALTFLRRQQGENGKCFRMLRSRTIVYFAGAVLTGL